MRRGIVLLMFLAAAIISFSTDNASAESDPCKERGQPTQTLNAPGTLTGTSGDDILWGSTGPDIINGKGGNDIICGNGGADWIDGGTGNDVIYASEGSTIYGGIGNDWIAAVDSWIDAGAGNDFMYAEGGTVYAQSGNDTVISEYKSATVDCGSGNDVYGDYSFNPNSIEGGAGVSCENTRRAG